MPVKTERVTMSGLSLRGYVKYPKLSEETIAFSGVVHHEESGRRLGSLENRGTGGETTFTPDSRECREVWDKAKAEFEPIPWGDGSKLSWGLEDALSVLADDVAVMTKRAARNKAFGFLVGEARDILASKEMQVLSIERRPRAKVRDVLESRSSLGVLVFGELNRSSGGVDVYVART